MYKAYLSTTNIIYWMNNLAKKNKFGKKYIFLIDIQNCFEWEPPQENLMKSGETWFCLIVTYFINFDNFGEKIN
jgi:hypothetical protein